MEPLPMAALSRRASSSLAGNISARRLARSNTFAAHESTLLSSLEAWIEQGPHDAERLHAAAAKLTELRDKAQLKATEVEAAAAAAVAAAAATMKMRAEPPVPPVVDDTTAAIDAELARVKALPEQERAAIGKKYTDPEALFAALEAGGGNATLILRASWVKTQRGGRLPKRGDPLPPEATITVTELRDIAKASTCTFGALPVIALSHFWRTKEHPDPDGETMELVVSALEEQWKDFQAKRVTDLGIVIDWCALWQAPRTSEQAIVFGTGLKGINQWYAHQGTTVWLVTAGADRVKGLTYWDKGWCSFEFQLSMLIKPANTSGMKDWAQVVDLGKPGYAQINFARPQLSEPLAFFVGHACGDKTYTNGADRDAIVAPKFRDTIFEVMGGVRELNFGTLKWGDAGVKALGVVLPLCGQLTKLQLHDNAIGDAGVADLVSAGGAMAQLQVIWRLNSLTPCLEPWQARSLGLTVLFDVPYVPYAEAFPPREPYW